MSTTTERLLRLPTVLDMVGLGKTTIYDMMKEGSFPRPRRVRNLSLWRRQKYKHGFVPSLRAKHPPVNDMSQYLDLISRSAPDQV